MKTVSTALPRRLALVTALMFAAGCATAQKDLAAIKDPGAPIEPVLLPIGLVRAPTDRLASAASTATQEPGKIILASAEEDAEPGATRRDKSPERGTGPTLEKRLRIPKELPGADAQVLRIPKRTPENDEKYRTTIRQLFPSLPDPPALDTGRPEEHPRLTLDEFEQLALANSPIIVQFQSDVSGQIGEAIQAGTHPNPTFGYESDTVGSNSTRNYQGAFLTQLIKTGGKLQLAQAIQNVDVMNSQLALRQARYDLLTDVRQQYFALLIARESLRINEAVWRFTHEVYRIQADQVAEGQAAPYEPSQLRALAVQSRGALVAARNRYVAAWKQLTATLNLPDMLLADLADNPSLAVPQLDFDAAVSHVLSMNTEARAARNGPIRARLSVRLAEITPIPDVNVYATVQRDFTTPGLARTTYNTQIGVPLPIFDRNKGNILTAQASLMRATQEVTRVQNDLRGRLADAFERYETNRMIVSLSRDQILPDAVRAYRGTYERHTQDPEDVGFADVIVAQQSLLNAVRDYITALNVQWTALTDIGSLLQVESLRELQLQLRDQGAPPAPLDEMDGGNDISSLVRDILTVSANDARGAKWEARGDRSEAAVEFPESSDSK